MGAVAFLRGNGSPVYGATTTRPNPVPSPLEEASMRSTWWIGAIVAGLLVCGPARAKIAGPEPLPQRVAKASVIVVGKVTGFSDRAVSAHTWWDPSGAKAEHQVALVDVKTVLLGDAKLKQVKIGFIPNERRRGLQPSAGEEGMYFLSPNPDGGFFALPGFFDRHPR